MTRLDDTDLRLIELLEANGRESWKNLAEQVGLSAPSVLERVRKLERSGLIRGYAALLDPESAGSPLLAFVFLTGSGPEYHARLSEQIAAMPEVQECHVTSGSFDYVLKIRCSSSRHLMRILQQLRADSGLKATDTTVTLATLKETPAVPVNAG